MSTLEQCAKAETYTAEFCLLERLTSFIRDKRDHFLCVFVEIARF